DEPDLNAQIVADRLANALERGWYFRKAGHTTIDRIME
ncbi:MAG: 30S ribosomal protein S3, partial [Haloarculaceae archaeon]